MRWLGLLPAAFLAVAAVVYVRAGTPGTLLWVCNVSNGLLAISMLAAWPRGIWIASLWLLAGVPLWLMDGFLGEGFQTHSFLTHFAAAAVGLVALRRLPRQRGVWWQAVAYAVSLQLPARLLTPPEENVNVAFTAYHSLSHVVPFAASFVLNILVFLVAMRGLEAILVRVYRSPRHT